MTLAVRRSSNNFKKLQAELRSSVGKAIAERARELLHGDNSLWRSLTQCLVASLTLILLTVVFYRLHLNLAPASLLYVIVVVLLSRAGSCGGAPIAVVRQYIEQQQTPHLRQRQGRPCRPRYPSPP